MDMHKLAAVMFAGSFALGIGPSQAACEGTVLFEDTFDDDLSGWVNNETFEKIENGKFFITPENDSSYAQLMPLFRFDDERICFEVNWESATSNSLDAGLLFWAVDYDNYYLAQIGKNPDGTTDASAYAKIDSQWNTVFLEPVTLTIEPGTANTLEIDIDGTVVSVSVNGEQVKQFRGLRPDGKPQFGLYAQTDPDGASAAFDYIKVTAPDS
jgi:hypothetical protein